MQKWHKIFPHLWLVFGQRAGLPQWQDGKLETEVRRFLALAPCRLAMAVLRRKPTLKCAISFATANVLSLSRGPDGHSGKLQYLFDQMHFSDSMYWDYKNADQMRGSPHPTASSALCPDIGRVREGSNCGSI